MSSEDLPNVIGNAEDFEDCDIEYLEPSSFYNTAFSNRKANSYDREHYHLDPIPRNTKDALIRSNTKAIKKVKPHE